MKGAGGTRLERMFCQFAVNTRYADGASDFVVPSFELLVFTQSSEFSNIVQDDGSFDDALENQRVLWHKTYPLVVATSGGAAGTAYITGFADVQVKSKMRLSDKSIGFAARLGYSVSGGVVATDVLANWTGYVSTP